MSLCIVEGNYQRFGGAYCLHVHGTMKDFINLLKPSGNFTYHQV
jgi:hypothetical protein